MTHALYTNGRTSERTHARHRLRKRCAAGYSPCRKPLARDWRCVNRTVEPNPLSLPHPLPPPLPSSSPPLTQCTKKINQRIRRTDKGIERKMEKKKHSTWLDRTIGSANSLYLCFLTKDKYSTIIDIFKKIIINCCSVCRFLHLFTSPPPPPHLPPQLFIFRFALLCFFFCF